MNFVMTNETSLKILKLEILASRSQKNIENVKTLKMVHIKERKKQCLIGKRSFFQI